MNDRSITSIIQNEYRDFSLYQVSKLPSVRDGLKPVSRRILQVARKHKGKGFMKVVELGGLVAPYHPHGEVSINGCMVTLGQDFVGSNNFPLIEKKGNYGTRLNGGAAAAHRYIWAKLSDFADKVMFEDEDIVNKIPIYDESREEVEFFLPIVPTILLNPSEAIAVGFACKIIPYNPVDVIENQIDHLRGKKLQKLCPFYAGYSGPVDSGMVCVGKYEKIGSKKIRITEAPIGYTREKYISKLDTLEERKKIIRYEDKSKAEFDITVSLPKKVDGYNPISLLEMLGLVKNLNQNLTFIDFDGESVRKVEDPNDVVRDFTDWRFGFYEERYKLLLEKCKKNLEYNSILYNVITSPFVKRVQNMTRKQMTAFISTFTKDSGIVDRICSLPVYRFNLDEKKKLEKILKDLKQEKIAHESMLKHKSKRKDQYIRELKSLKKWFKDKI